VNVIAMLPRGNFGDNAVVGPVMLVLIAGQQLNEIAVIQCGNAGIIARCFNG
jgi:hypothetical protein